MEFDPIYLVCTIPAIMLYGIAKSGLGGSMALISIPLMTVVMPLSQADKYVIHFTLELFINLENFTIPKLLNS